MRQALIQQVIWSGRMFARLRALPSRAREEVGRDRRGLFPEDPGSEVAVHEAIAWLKRAQDHSVTQDGGVARHYCLITGWGPSYPETTGYLVPTMLRYARLSGDRSSSDRAKKMLDWLVSLQFPDGGFPGGTIADRPQVPVTFNTGQILVGLAEGARVFEETYREPMRRAADWLVATQDPDGCWRRHPSPFTVSGEKTYETHVAWGLLEAARVMPSRRYGEAALANVHWALRWQMENGWFDRCCLSHPSQPQTHTIGYVLRGIVEAYRFSKDPVFLGAARRTADGLLNAIGGDGFIPGRLRSDWRGTTPWACLTGTVQIAHCWLMLYQDTGRSEYLEAARKANRFVRRTMRIDGPPETRGGIKGSFPVHGLYSPFQYLNWTAKFLIDANLLEMELEGRRLQGQSDGVFTAGPA